jgi:hypothetical protein
MLGAPLEGNVIHLLDEYLSPMACSPSAASPSPDAPPLGQIAIGGEQLAVCYLYRRHGSLTVPSIPTPVRAH